MREAKQRGNRENYGEEEGVTGKWSSSSEGVKKRIRKGGIEEKKRSRIHEGYKPF
jgi:hypothetical protein